MTAKQIETFLRTKYRVPETVIRELRVTYADRAVKDTYHIKMNRILSLAALVLHREFNFGLNRLTRFLNRYVNDYAEFADSDDSWGKLMETLRNETGIIIRTGEEGDEITEYTEGE